MQESLSSEHRGELFGDSLEHFLDGSWVTNESNSHLQTLWWDITDWRLDVVWNPLNEIWWVLVLNVQHLFVDFFGWHSSSEQGWSGQISSVSWIGSAHHVLGIEHLLGEFWDGQSSVLLWSSWSEWGESNHEEVESGEWNQVDGQFSQIWVELTWESEAAGNTWHGSRDQMVKIAVGWGGELESSETDIVKGFVINDHAFISVLDQLMDWEGGVVWFNDCVRDLWWWDNWESLHDSVGIFFSDLWDKESTHTWTCSTSQWVSDLESLKTITSLSLLSGDIEYWVDQFSSFSVVTFGPVVTGTTLPEDEVVWSEELTERSGSDWVHGSWFKIHKDCSWDVSTTGCFVEINVDSFELKIWVSVIGTSWVNSVFVWDDLPELGTDLVTALTGLDVDDFSHLIFEYKLTIKIESRR